MRAGPFSHSPFRIVRAALILGSVLLSGCGIDVWPEREAATVADIRVEGIAFLPPGSRFVLEDSASPLRFTRFHAGYACSRVLEMGLDSVTVGNPPAFGPATKVRLPAAPDCGVDTVGRDTTVAYIFKAGPETVRLANSSGRITDSARLVRGALAYDSLSGKLGIARTFSRGPWEFRDSTGLADRRLFGDSLPACRYLNQAEFSVGKDTVVTVRLSYVTLDPSGDPDACAGEAHRDSVPVLRARQ